MAASLLQTLASLALVVGVIFGLGWMTRRLRTLRGGASGPSLPMQVENALSVGAKEKVMMIRAGGQHFLIGVTAGQVSLLHRFHGEPDAVHGPAEIIPFSEHLRRPH